MAVGIHLLTWLINRSEEFDRVDSDAVVSIDRYAAKWRASLPYLDQMIAHVKAKSAQATTEKPTDSE
jgi:hypothetical protein